MKKFCLLTAVFVIAIGICPVQASAQPTAQGVGTTQVKQATVDAVKDQPWVGTYTCGGVYVVVPFTRTKWDAMSAGDQERCCREATNTPTTLAGNGPFETMTGTSAGSKQENLMGVGTWIIIIVAGVIVAVVIGARNLTKKKKAMEDHLGALAEFSATQQVIGTDANTGLAIDEHRKKICLIVHTQLGVTSYVLSYRDVLSSEIFEDGTTITKTVRSSQIGAALIGGLVFGGVGAIVGSLTGKTQSSSGKVKKVDLRLIVNDTAKPLHDIAFLGLETKRDNIPYKQAIERARHWHGLIEVLIKRADLEDKATNAGVTPAIPSGSVADELRKFAELLDAGVLSLDEFQRQKTRLLSA